MDRKLTYEFRAVHMLDNDNIKLITKHTNKIQLNWSKSNNNKKQQKNNNMEKQQNQEKNQNNWNKNTYKIKKGTNIEKHKIRDEDTIMTFEQLDKHWERERERERQQ